MKILPALVAALMFTGFASAQPTIMKTDVLVIGGGTGGTAAALQSARMGVKTILVEETRMLGGMLTAAGVSCTDGNDQLPSGIWEEFRQALYRHYGKNRLNSGWVSHTSFEPRVGDSIFRAWAKKEKNLEVLFQHRLAGLIRDAQVVKGATVKDSNGREIQIEAKLVVDATELGDVMAMAGAAYDLGMDDRAETGETEAKEKNDIIQDLTWSAILKDYGANADNTIPKPKNYDARRYHCCNTDAPCDDKPWNGDKFKMLDYGKLPRSPGATHDKYMLNWPIHGNDYYLDVVESNNEQRAEGYELAKQQTLGFIYFLQTELGLKHIGLADDELDGGLAWIPYNREGRRLKGKVRMNVNHIKQPHSFTLYRTGISVGDYPIDHHHDQYPGKMPALEFPPVPSFNIPLGCLIPASTQGLIICEKGISVTNIVNGTTRLQPIVLLTGQAAGMLAAMSVRWNKQPANISVRTLQNELLKAKCYLLPYVDLKPGDPFWEDVQKTGLSGLLRGTGKPEGWSNKTFFYPDSIISVSEFSADAKSYGIAIAPVDSILSCSFAVFIAQQIGAGESAIGAMRSDDITGKHKAAWVKAGLGDYDPARPVTRKELAVLLNRIAGVFEKREVKLDGSFLAN